MAEPVADSDEELVELIQVLAAYSGPVQPAVRHRQPATGPAPAGRLPAVRGDGRDPAPGDLHPAGPDGQGVPGRPGRQRHDQPGRRLVPRRRGRGAEEHHDRRGHQRRQDHAAARAGQPDPGRGAAHHRGARPGAGPGSLPRAAPQRGRVRGAAAEHGGPGRHHPGRAGPPVTADEPEPGHRRRGARRRDRHHAQRHDPGQRRLPVDHPRQLLARGVQPHLHLRDPGRRTAPGGGHAHAHRGRDRLRGLHREAERLRPRRPAAPVRQQRARGHRDRRPGAVQRGLRARPGRPRGPARPGVLRR